ncbi:MAG: FAD-binding protein [Tateyamaria sp.]|uniref:FAD-binding protein n=1 Tax=Tateyamaria sp. TaxID=1929288 RepID=UPI003290CC91
MATREISPKNPVLDGVNLIVPSKEKSTLNDASRLSETPIYKHIILQDDPGEALISALRNELAEAKQSGRAVNIGAARHSMGGQAIPRDGHAITLQNAWVEAGDGIYRVQAGARWKDVIGALDPVGLSPKVMQTNSDFGIGATFSVNAHGWPTAFGPMGSTVRSIKIMLADGSLVSASRSEHPDIFAAAMGGYGLIGLLIELELEAAPAALLEPSFDEMPAENFAETFVNVARNVPMAYGRLNIDRANFFKDALLITYRAVEGELPKASVPGYRSYLTRKIFRSQTGNEWVKRRRWGMETGLGPILAGPVSRSGVMNESVKTLLGESGPDRTDIIHEYFVAPDRFNDFLTVCRDIIPSSYQELLNITMRWVEQDSVSLLSYAPSGPRIASVLSFSQEMSARAENDMKVMTRDLIDAVLALGGSYYLPYRPHATVAQFSEGYKQASEFGQFKRQTDPKTIFRNALWDNYLARI